MLDKRIIFDESFISEEDDTITFYFIAPKDLFYRADPEAEHMEISVECPRGCVEARYAYVEVSPTKYFEEEDSYVDYDWQDLDLPYDEIEALIKLAEESGRM